MKGKIKDCNNCGCTFFVEQVLRRYQYSSVTIKEDGGISQAIYNNCCEHELDEAEVTLEFTCQDCGESYPPEYGGKVGSYLQRLTPEA